MALRTSPDRLPRAKMGFSALSLRSFLKSMSKGLFIAYFYSLQMCIRY